ncbi:FG-GAP repeat domain-containing protein [Streptomyces vilmorinianum]|uniref:FG-GAP repeat domain-containing protein n=1 Tax=Streptomyces vilmorinianum TaxID=3051092 RepID=UPI0010FB6B59|nr:VCBS repeat-containing protein [Streptomyces vilmorinianum]
MHHAFSSRRRLAAAIGTAIAVTVGTLAAPAVAAPIDGTAPATTTPDGTAVTTATDAQQTVVPYPLDARVISAGRTGFLTLGTSGSSVEHRWTRFADGSSTVLSSGGTWVVGSRASDVVVLNDNSLVTLRDMAAGANLLTVDLRSVGSGGQYGGAVGSTLFARTSNGVGGEDLHLLSKTDGTLTDRTVTGLPANATAMFAAAATSDHVLLTYQTGTGTVAKRFWALLDLSTGAVTETREIVTPAQWTGEVALSETHVAWVEYGSTSPAVVVVADRGTGKTQRVPMDGASRVSIGLVGTWVTYADRDGFGDYHPNPFSALRARHLTTGETRKLLDHVKSAVQGPDGTQSVRGGTVAQGEGLYRISVGADGAPVTELVASTGEPTKVTLLGGIPAKVTPDPANGRIRLDWRLSRVNAEVTVTLRHVQSGETKREVVYPSGDLLDDPHLVRLDWQGDVSWNGDRDMLTGARSGAYTWEINAKPLDGIGPNLVSSGTFDLARKPAPHDYDNDGHPDILRRDASGRLWLADTFYSPYVNQLDQHPDRLIGSGWGIYDQIEAVGNIAGASAGDLVARDSSGVLWEYLGKGDGTFAGRVKIGAGWGVYNKITGGSDLTGDGKSDLLATDTSGGLYLYKGTGNWSAPFAPRVKIGYGWGIYNQITATGNIAGATAGDLVARDKDGVLWLYLGNGDGTFATRIKIGGGWNTYTHLIGIGDADRDGRPDLYASGSTTSSSFLYKGTGNWRAPFRSREQVGEHFEEWRSYNHFA